MNDRYLFKAKRKDWKELPKEEWWAVGYLIIDEQDENRHFIGYVFGTNEDGTPHDFDVVEVDPATICQCTGLKDKNGTLIFENDIVCHKYYEDKEPKKVGVVGFGDFNCSCCHGVYGWHFGDEDIRDVGSYSVIGNIFDNPELLEVE